jgi:phosphoglycolate phosphatase
MMNLTHIRAALVDLDGTLVDTVGDFVAVLNALLTQMNLPLTTALQVQQTVGKGSDHLVRSTLQQVAPSLPFSTWQPQWPHIMDAYKAHYHRINGKHSTLYPGVTEGLQMLHQQMGWPLVCLTNKPKALAQGLLNAKGLDEWFAHVVGGDSYAHTKPHPAPLLGACQQLGCAPGQVLMIGDSANDAQAARAAGCPVVLVTYGYNHGQPVHQVDADGFIDRLDHLPTIHGLI